MDALVSVICTTYNHEKYIRKTLEGFVSQKTTFPVEYIIHDDASTDATATVIREFEKKYPKVIKPIYQTVNQYSRGGGIIRKIQMQISSRYTALCEGDDYWIDENKLQKQIDYMEAHPGCVLTIHNGYRLNDHTGQLKPLNPYKKSGTLSMKEVLLEEGGMTPTASMVYRTDIIKKMPMDIFKVPGVGDRPKRMYLATQGEVMYFSEIMCIYRTNNSNSFGGMISENREKSKKLLSDMMSFFVRFDEYTGDKYSEEVAMIKSREQYLYLIREHDYSNASKTMYYRTYTTLPNKIKDFIKWRMPESLLYKINLIMAKLSKK